MVHQFINNFLWFPNFKILGGKKWVKKQSEVGGCPARLLLNTPGKPPLNSWFACSHPSSLVAQRQVKNLPANAGDVGLIPGSGRSPGEGNATHSSILPGKSHGQKSLMGYSAWDHRIGSWLNNSTTPHLTPGDKNLTETLKSILGIKDVNIQVNISGRESKFA